MICVLSELSYLFLRTMWNSELCRLETETYGNSNSCSFLTTRRERHRDTEGGMKILLSGGREGGVVETEGKREVDERMRGRREDHSVIPRTSR